MAKYKKKLEDDICWPLEYSLAIFGGKWKPYDEIPPKVEYSLTQKENQLFLFCRAAVSGQMSSIKKMAKMKRYSAKMFLYNRIIRDGELLVK